MTGSISSDDRALIERIRRVNKTLSMFVFALQEQSNVPTESQLGIADMLVALAETVRVRASQQAAGNDSAELLFDSGAGRLQIDASHVTTDIEQPDDPPARLREGGEHETNQHSGRS